MKLIPLIIITISFAVDNDAHEFFTFPQQFKGSQPGMYSTEKQFYLPPENPTVLPYYPMKSFNNVPLSYLPATISKASSGTLSPFPVTLNATLLPFTSAEDDDNEENNSPAPLPPYLRNQYNQTNRYLTYKQEMRQMPKHYQQPIDRIDTRLPIQFNNHSEPTLQNLGMQSVSPRTIMIQNVQRDPKIDQVKAAYSSPKYIPQSSDTVSTTETAIPILRLSNEMDLDGSFSYEALGADQTHYEQHSRMENMGSGKEEQVVEGSYSYVGDDGKTYAVHYIADSNGFRASGDHLPVPPPVPEIIQRAIQYNLAEEQKKPPHLKAWTEEENENETIENERRNHFVVSPPRLNNLFTGKTPESFSHSFSQSSDTQNNMMTVASSQAPIQTVDMIDQMRNKPNSGTIAPQITFLASQGAQIPSVNVFPQQQSMGRILTSEKPLMPQTVNYEANMKEADQDNNRALWRWQYGMNANSNPNLEKKLISRSSSEDDVNINFSEMTADEYTNMLQYLEPNIRSTTELPQSAESTINEKQYYDDSNSFLDVNGKHQHDRNNLLTNRAITRENQYSTERVTPFSPFLDKQEQSNYNRAIEEKPIKTNSENILNSRAKLITQDLFIPHSQIVTQSYNYDNIDFESRKIRNSNKNTDNNYVHVNNIPVSDRKNTLNHTMTKTGQFQIEQKNLQTQETSTTKPISKIKFSDFIVPEDNDNGFKPIASAMEKQPKEITTTTEISIENMMEENIFLINLFRNKKNNSEIANTTNKNTNIQVKPPAESKADIYSHFEPYNEIKTSSRNPIEVGDIMNYLYRNQFESAKVRSKPKQQQTSSQQKANIQYFATEGNQALVKENMSQNQRVLQQQNELRGAIKNYKVLQRHNNFINAERNNVDELKRNLRPPPMKAVGLPPLGRAGPTMKTYLPPVYVL